jgi:hypothetical protein
MTKGMFMIFKIFKKKFYLDKTAYMQGVPQSSGPSITKILSYKKNMNDISLNDIDNLVNCACNRLESKIIKSEIMDGSGHTIDIKLYFYDDAKIGGLSSERKIRDHCT